MKENTVFIIKEVAMCLGLSVIAVGLNVFLFKNYFTGGIELEDAKTNIYASIDKSKYILINADIQEEQNPTQKYETVNKELDDYQTEYRYVPGTVNPFVSDSSINDLPSEVVGVSGDATEENNN